MDNTKFYEVTTYCMRGSMNTRSICTALRKIGIKTIHINVTHSIFEWENKERDITEDRIDF